MITLALLAATAGAVSVTPSYETKFFNQRVDHFSARLPPSNNYTWSQRYLVNDTFFDPDTGCIFFYNGNESPVTLYAEHTGLIWENAKVHKALIVFAEHRYYGASWPLQTQAASLAHMEYLSSQQALADYASLIHSVRLEMGIGSSIPLIAFGGSYGGVLSAMFRAAYPGSVDGAIASSAPLRAFPGQVPAWDSANYYAVITNAATSAGGSPDACAANMRNLWAPFFADSKTPEGLTKLSASFSTCTPLGSEDDALSLAGWIRGTWDTMAMGSYPYPSNYLTGGGDVYLPAYPLRVACSALSTLQPPQNLYAAVATAMQVLNNATPVACNDIPPNPFSHPELPYDGIWDWQQCTEFQPDSEWFTSNGVTDMFFPSPYNLTFLLSHCQQAWGVVAPDLDFMTIRHALPSFHGASRILFTNGLLDSWSGGGLTDSPAPERDLIVMNISDSGHHLDLFFTNPADPPSVTNARLVEMAYVTKWVEEARRERASRM